MFDMSQTHLSAVDLNLLLHLQALLEERNVTKAGRRVHLTQSAMSRSLERLRDVLQDDLLVRSKNGYELTTKALTLSRELETLIPKLEAFWAGRPFTPAMSSGEMRILMTD